MIRAALCITYITLFLIVTTPLRWVARLIARFDPYKAAAFSNHTVTYGLKGVLFFAGVHATVIGRENIPDCAVLYAANHRSYFDIIYTGSYFTRPTGFVAKDALAKVPLLSSWMRLIHCKFIDRQDMRQSLQVILECIEDIKNGISIFIFPEGTRNKGEEGSVLPFHDGSFKIAQKTGCPIVPVAISNTQAIFERQFPAAKSAHIVVEYCKPVYIDELSSEDKKALGIYVRHIILDKLKEHEGMY